MIMEFYLHYNRPKTHLMTEYISVNILAITVQISSFYIMYLAVLYTFTDWLIFRLHVIIYIFYADHKAHIYCIYAETTVFT